MSKFRKILKLLDKANDKITNPKLLEETRNLLWSAYELLEETFDKHNTSLKDLYDLQDNLESYYEYGDEEDSSALDFLTDELDKIILEITYTFNSMSNSSSEYDTDESNVDSESESSVDSEDSEFGASQIMRKFGRHLADTKTVNIDKSRENNIISEEEIKANPGKYYIVLSKGDKLDYFPDNQSRREFVKNCVDNTLNKTPNAYESQAIEKIKSDKKPQERASAIEQLKKNSDVRDVQLVSAYKSPTCFPSTVKKMGGKYGNPWISTSKMPPIASLYADHASKKEDVFPRHHPKYHYNSSQPGKPRHRLIGMHTVFIYEANDYIAQKKADIEVLRLQGKVGKKCAVERDNEEVIIPYLVKAENVAGYVPLIYPNFESPKKLLLYGIEPNNPEIGRVVSPTPKTKTLSKNLKEHGLFKKSSKFIWGVAQKAIPKKVNDEDKVLLWVDSEGNFRTVNNNLTAKKTDTNLAPMQIRSRTQKPEFQR